VTLLKSYDPFGNTLLDQGEGTSGLSYTGEQMDESGLEYLRARYYNPEIGRFISADSFPGVLSLPATQNAYPYGITTRSVTPTQVGNPAVCHGWYRPQGLRCDIKAYILTLLNCFSHCYSSYHNRKAFILPTSRHSSLLKY
jgi:RHS repeat-associated protein